MTRKYSIVQNVNFTAHKIIILLSTEQACKQRPTQTSLLMQPCPWTCTSASSLVAHLAAAHAQLAVPTNRRQATDNSPITAAMCWVNAQGWLSLGSSNAHGSCFTLKITSFFFLHGAFHCECIIFLHSCDTGSLLMRVLVTLDQQSVETTESWFHTVPSDNL